MNTGFVGNNQTLVLPAVYTSYINNDFVRLYGHRVGVFKLSIVLTNTCRRVESYFFMTSPNIPHICTTSPNIKCYTLTHHTTSPTATHSIGTHINHYRCYIQFRNFNTTNLEENANLLH